MSAEEKAWAALVRRFDRDGDGHLGFHNGEFAWLISELLKLGGDAGDETSAYRIAYEIASHPGNLDMPFCPACEPADRQCVDLRRLPQPALSRRPLAYDVVVVILCSCTGFSGVRPGPQAAGLRAAAHAGVFDCLTPVQIAFPCSHLLADLLGATLLCCYDVGNRSNTVCCNDMRRCLRPPTSNSLQR